jgi:nucleoside diphosphate kinase
MSTTAPIEYAFYLIKPDAFDRREAIRSYIETVGGFVLGGHFTLTLTDRDVVTLFGDDKNTALLTAIQIYLSGKEVEVGLVTGKDVLQRFLTFTGHSFRPNECAAGTIRREFGQDVYVAVNDIRYYFNAIHRASITELPAALDWFNKKKPRE